MEPIKEVTQEEEARNDAANTEIDPATGAPVGAEVISREEAIARGIDVDKAEVDAESEAIIPGEEAPPAEAAA